MKTSFFCKLFLFIYLINHYECYKSHYWSVRPSGKRYFYQYWKGLLGCFHLLINLHRHPIFGRDAILRSWMKRILMAYIKHRGTFYIIGIRLFFTRDPKLNPNYNPSSLWRSRGLAEVSEEDKQKADLMQKSFNSLESHTSQFFEVGAESVTPILCLNTEEGNIPGKLIDMEKPVYISNNEVKTCEQFHIVPETKLIYHHQIKSYSCGPRGHNTNTNERLWNAVYFGDNGNILGQADTNLSTITYIEDGEVKTSHESFAVLC